MKRKTENKERKTNKRERIFCFLVLLLLLSSCHTRKKLVSPMVHAADYEWMTAKMTGEVIMDREAIPFSGTLRMRRDSVIWFSANAMMGMEAVRARITCDSVVVINRLEKTYLAEPIEELSESLHPPLSLKECQSMLLGNGLSDHVELQVGLLSTKIRYSDICWDEPTTFPIKINQNYERVKP